MVPCATTYEIEQQFQAVYTISKFREVQVELAGKVYCDIISTADVYSGSTYEVCDDVLCGDRRKRKRFVVLFNRENCDIVCTCHLFEFRGVLCRHAIVVLICNDVRVLPDRYVLRRWRRDVSRAHTRIDVIYSGLVSTPGQLRYDRMCQAFATITDLAAEDGGRTHAIMEWIGIQEKELMSSRLISGSNVLLQLLDPNAVNKKGAPKRVRRKGPFESTSKKPTAPSKGKRPTARRTYPPDAASSIQAHQQHDSSMSIPFSYSQLLLGDHESQVFPQQFPTSTPIHPSSTHPTFNSQDVNHPGSMKLLAFPADEETVTAAKYVQPGILYN
ncbi:protein FAR1-RELATED SEQUENCE 2-like [Olea europaea var. sylvestris]|uniref:protein FAR1-RELATED SEQUENCE 2-like n=1 Tax=Olea europaea var. sylvestris TaxID=158386 RepID=UPI000C1D8708|nr:protein FAR1-RELATED SEQUENCE 2-like [Olea europaea var. sylvestris]